MWYIHVSLRFPFKVRRERKLMSWVCSDICIYFHYSQEHRSRALPSRRTVAHGFVRQMWEERWASGSNLQAVCGRDFIFLSGWGTLATVLGPCNLCWSAKPPCFSIIPVEAFRKHLGYSAPKWLPLLLEEVWSARVLLQSSLGSRHWLTAPQKCIMMAPGEWCS